MSDLPLAASAIARYDSGCDFISAKKDFLISHMAAAASGGIADSRPDHIDKDRTHSIQHAERDLRMAASSILLRA